DLPIGLFLRVSSRVLADAGTTANLPQNERGMPAGCSVDTKDERMVFFQNWSLGVLCCAKPGTLVRREPVGVTMRQEDELTERDFLEIQCNTKDDIDDVVCCERCSSRVLQFIEPGLATLLLSLAAMPEQSQSTSQDVSCRGGLPSAADWADKLMACQTRPGRRTGSLLAESVSQHLVTKLQRARLPQRNGLGYADGISLRPDCFSWPTAAFRSFCVGFRILACAASLRARPASRTLGRRSPIETDRTQAVGSCVSLTVLSMKAGASPELPAAQSLLGVAAAREESFALGFEARASQCFAEQLRIRPLKPGLKSAFLLLPSSALDAFACWWLVHVRPPLRVPMQAILNAGTAVGSRQLEVPAEIAFVFTPCGLDDKTKMQGLKSGADCFPGSFLCETDFPWLTTCPSDGAVGECVQLPALLPFRGFEGAEHKIAAFALCRSTARLRLSFLAVQGLESWTFRSAGLKVILSALLATPAYVSFKTAPKIGAGLPDDITLRPAFSGAPQEFCAPLHVALFYEEFCAPLHFALFYEAKRQGKDRAKEESGAFQVCGGVTPSCKPHVASSDVRLMSAALSPRWHLPPPDLDISVLREGASPEFDVPSSPAGPRQFGVGRACSMGIKGYGGYGCLPTSRPPTLPLPTGPLGTTGGTSGFGVPADPGAAASPPEKALFVVNSLAVLDVSELGQRAPMYMRLAVAQVQLNFEDLMAWSVNAQAVIFRAAEGTSTVDLGSTVSRRVEPCYHCECSHIVRGSAGKFVGLTVESRARCAGANEFQVQDQSERVWSGRALQVLQPFFRSCKPPKQRVQALQLHQGRLQDPREAAPWRSATWLKVSLLAESDSSAGLVDRVHANRKKILTGTPRTPFSVSALAHSGVALLQLWSPSPLGTGFAAQLTMHEAGTFRVVVFQVPLYASEAKLDAHDADAGEEAQEPWVKLAEDMPTAAPGGQIARLPPVLPLLREAPPHYIRLLKVCRAFFFKAEGPDDLKATSFHLVAQQAAGRGWCCDFAAKAQSLLVR
ncbi:unnamed protein product, partial [Symbiodinium microadriaticum]